MKTPQPGTTTSAKSATEESTAYAIAIAMTLVARTEPDNALLDFDNNIKALKDAWIKDMNDVCQAAGVPVALDIPGFPEDIESALAIYETPMENHFGSVPGYLAQATLFYITSAICVNLARLGVL